MSLQVRWGLWGGLEYYIILGRAEIPVSEDINYPGTDDCESLSADMKVFVSFLIFGASLVLSAPSRLQSTILPNQLGSDAVQVSRFIGPFSYPEYYIYNYLPVDPSRGIPVAIFSNGNPSVANAQPTYTYYGMPVYDYRYLFNQILPSFPGFQPPSSVPGEQPSFVPAQGPTFHPTTQRPFDDDDGIEKLDEKLDPSLEGNAGGDSQQGDDNDDDDTVTIEAL